MGLGMILDTAVGMFPQKIGPLLQLLTALLSNKSTVKKVHGENTQAHLILNLCSSILTEVFAGQQVYNFLDKMSFYTQFYKHKPNDVVSREDETVWRRQTPKLLYPLGNSLHFLLSSFSSSSSDIDEY